MKENTKLKWGIVGSLGIIAWILAFIGFNNYFVSNGIERSFLDLIFHATKIFGMELVDEYASPLPIALEIARWLAPGVLLYSVVTGVIHLIGRTFLLARVRRTKDHVVIEGINKGSTYLVTDLLKKGLKVIVVSEDFTDIEKELIEREGAVLITGTLKDQLVLKSINAGKASHIICFEKEDEKNIASSVNVFNYLKGSSEIRKPVVHAHVDDIQLLREFKDIHFFENLNDNNTEGEDYNVRIFSVIEQAARLIFNNYGPEKFVESDKKQDDPVSILMIGDNDISETILVHFTRMCQYANFKKMIVNFYHTDQKVFERITNAYPEIESYIELKTRLIDPELITSDIIAESNEFHPLDAIYIISDSDETVSIMLNKTAAIGFGKDLNTVAVMNTLDSVLLQWYNKNSLGDLVLHKFNMVAETHTEEAIIGSEIDKLAQYIHNDYFNKIKEAGKVNPEKESHREWEALSEDFKNQNRFQADHIQVKLRSINCEAVPVSDSREEYDFTQDAELVELLSKMEHNRWAAHMAMNGWKYGSVRDDKRKTHTDLIEYEKLSDDIKQYDRDTVLNMKNILSKMNLIIAKDK